MKQTEEGFPIWEADYVPGPEESIIPGDIAEGDLVQDILPLSSGSINITAAQLKQLLVRTAEIAYEAAEARRLTFAKTPDGLRDKTIKGYQPVPYHTALSQSSSIKDVPLTGTEEWKGDSINPIPSSCADRLFLSYPKPLLLSERCNAETP